jgi:hypothetical protein
MLAEIPAFDLPEDRALRSLWPQLPEPRVVAWSEQPVVVLDRGAPWLYGPVDRDPLMTVGGHTVLPRREIRRLRELAALDIPFQRLAVAHELDPDGPVSELLPVLRDGPRICSDDIARALVGPQPAHPVVHRAARMLEAVISRAAVARAVEKILDPILFGVVGMPDPTHGRPALFYPLAAWRW